MSPMHRPVRDITCERLERHPVVAAVEQRVGVADFLRVIQLEMARKAAELEFVRLHADFFDPVEEGRAITRAVRQLRRMAELALAEHRVMGPPPLSLANPSVDRVVALLIDRVVAVAREPLPAATIKAIVEPMSLIAAGPSRQRPCPP